MSKTIRLDQVFYGSGPGGYGILATSLAETSIAQSAVNACLAVGQIPGSGLAKPVFLARVLGDLVVMARLCNGARDSSGRNTLFIHALVGSAQEVRSAHVSTFSLEDAGVFCDKTSEASSRPITGSSLPWAARSLRLMAKRSRKLLLLLFSAIVLFSFCRNYGNLCSFSVVLPFWQITEPAF